LHSYKNADDDDFADGYGFLYWEIKCIWGFTSFGNDGKGELGKYAIIEA